MQRVKETVKRVFPFAVPLVVRAHKARYRLRRSSRELAKSAVWWADPRGIVSRARMSAYAGCHRGERCFIIGNGPSINQTDLSLLRHDVKFVMNRGYLLFDRLGGTQGIYFLSVNELVIQQFAADIMRLDMPRFLSWKTRDSVPLAPGTVFFHTTGAAHGFSKHPQRVIYEGNTVTFAAMQWAYFMGFREVILIGVDHSFTTQGKPHETVTTADRDPNHFDPHYFGRGVNWQLPDLDGSEVAYRIARQVYEADGRVIRDATVGGKLNVFPKVAYESLF
ncbi:hypothetical protein HC928_02940 [bacterium]|nr:hypothetical protein [bacterium]